MTSNIRSPFAGKPKTVQTVDSNGAPLFIVSPRVLTPFRAKAADILTPLAALAGTIYAVLQVFAMPDANVLHWLAALAGPSFVGVILNPGVRWLFRKRSHIILGVNQVSLRRRFGTKIYDRQLPHKFSLIEHDKALDEKDAHEFQIMAAQTKRKAVRKVRYYTESWHLSFDYLGQRNDLMTIFGRKSAQAVLARLKAIDEVLDSAASKGQGTPLSPQDEWGEQPGQIPDDLVA